MQIRRVHVRWVMAALLAVLVVPVLAGCPKQEASDATNSPTKPASGGNNSPQIHGTPKADN